MSVSRVTFYIYVCLTTANLNFLCPFLLSTLSLSFLISIIERLDCFLITKIKLGSESFTGWLVSLLLVLELELVLVIVLALGIER